MAKKKISGTDDILNQPVRYGSPRRDHRSIFIRYGPPRQDPEKPVRKEPKKPREPETIKRYGCPRPEISKKPSKLRPAIKSQQIIFENL